MSLAPRRLFWILLPIAALVGPVNVAIQLEYPDRLEITMLLGLISLCSIPVGLVIIVWGASSRKWLGVILGCCLLVSLGASAWLRKREVERRYSETILRSEMIVDALNSYRSDRGAFPTTLQHLTPTYLQTVPCTAVSQLRVIQFEYYPVDDISGFYLGFPVLGGEYCSRGELTEWSCSGS